ncbi:helix-turn-helix transcriptional regulator (plasmid) [Haloferax sp. S1W]|uniref:helix-turn-helix transcriptional regulator n=1 Tax=Haloferax sp. S1W TaxID=3377110 RepID=UPI0037C57F98
MTPDTEDARAEGHKETLLHAESDSNFAAMTEPVVEVDADHPLLGVDPELLNPERRILQLLLIEGGSLAQSALVERTRWSESTISRTLCRMETQERIERHQRGTGKIVILPQKREP